MAPPTRAAAAGHEASPWRATGLEPPVFWDRSGRRRRRVAAAGGAVSALVAAWLVALLIGATGLGSLPALRILRRAAPAVVLSQIHRPVLRASREAIVLHGRHARGHHHGTRRR